MVMFLSPGRGDRRVPLEPGGTVVVALGFALLLAVSAATPTGPDPRSLGAPVSSPNSSSQVSVARPVPSLGAHRATNATVPRWVEMCAGGNDSGLACESQPPPLEGAALSYDPYRQVGLLFGGEQPGTTNVTASTFAFSASPDLSEIWANVSPTGPIPAARSNSSMAYDLADNYTLLFGGWSSSGDRFLNDSYRWNPSLTAWTPVATPSGLGGRAGACMFSVPSGGARSGYILLFGGESGPGGVGAGYPTSTWEYRSGVWTNVSSTAGPPPSGRAMAGCAYDPAIGAGVVFGGRGVGGATLGDTWEWNVSSARWTLVSSGGTSA